MQRIYEDNIEGKISDERFAKMSASYESEQKQLESRVTELQTTIDQVNEKTDNVESFLKLVRQYTNIPELDAEIIRTFVKRINVYKPEKVDGRICQRIQIEYNCIGEFQLPKA